LKKRPKTPATNVAKMARLQDLLAFSAKFSIKDLKKMQRVIAEDCERVDADFQSVNLQLE
jgi:hypothetical protein